MAVGEERPTQKHRRKMPSFSSSLLDAIYHSIDEPLHHQPPPQHPLRRNAADEEIESLRRAIMIEKWIENYTTAAASRRHLPSHSASSTDSSIFTSSETDSSTPKPAPLPVQKLNKPDRENRFTRTKSKALKIYGDLKKVKEPISPGGRIANFLNSIFSPRNLKRENINPDWSSVRKSRSMKDTTSTPCSLQSRSCLTKNTNNPSKNNNKSKRSVRFCPVSVVLDEDNNPTSHNRMYDRDRSVPASMAAAANVVVGSRFIKKNIDSIRMFENDIHRDFDDKSCASSDLFELENFGAFEAELPVYGTTDLRVNRAIATRD